jgi:transposase
MQDNTNKKRGTSELTPLERELRNKIIRQWSQYGITISSISHIFKMHASTVSRIVDSTDSE